MNNISQQEWVRFLNETVDYKGKTNFKFSFKDLSKKYGKCYISYLKAAYLAKDTLSDEEFCRLNHCPINLINKFKS